MADSPTRYIVKRFLSPFPTLALLCMGLLSTQTAQAQGQANYPITEHTVPLAPAHVVFDGAVTPEEYQGDIMGDLNRRRGKIMSIETKTIVTSVNAEVPLSEMFGYATSIRSLSKGRASYSMEPSHFEQVPAQVLAAVLDQKN